MPDRSDYTIEENTHLEDLKDTLMPAEFVDLVKGLRDLALSGEVEVDEPAEQVVEPAKQVIPVSFETPKPPTEPPTDRFARTYGTVKMWARRMHFGAIARDDGGPDVFAQAINLKHGTALNVGDYVSFHFIPDGRGGTANNVAVVVAAKVREFGIVKRWRQSAGYGIIYRDNKKANVYCHTEDLRNVVSLIRGSRVSYFIDETGIKGGTARDVYVTRAAIVMGEDIRVTGVVTLWSTTVGFGFIKWNSEHDAFGHKRESPDLLDLAIGQEVSFVPEFSPKGVYARNIQKEGVDWSMAEGQLGCLYGTIMDYDKEKDVLSIARCDSKGRIVGQKCNFLDEAEPAPGMAVSFVLSSSPDGDRAMEIREEDDVLGEELSDEGLEFGPDDLLEIGSFGEWVQAKTHARLQRTKSMVDLLAYCDQASLEGAIQED